MSDRKAVMLLMFDLPSVTVDDRREYHQFMKAIKKNGFLQLQESCYLKLIRNIASIDQTMNSLRKIMPKRGNVSVLPLNLSSFAGMKSLCGESFDMDLFIGDVYVFGNEEGS